MKKWFSWAWSRVTLFIGAVAGSSALLGWLHLNSHEWEKQRPWFDFVMAGIIGTVWGLFLARVEYLAAIESIAADGADAKENALKIEQRKGTEKWRATVRVAGGVFSIAAAILVVRAAFLPLTHRMVAVGSGTVIDTMLERRDLAVCKELSLGYIDSGSREAIPLLVRRYSVRNDKGAFAVMANRYETKASQGGDDFASRLLVTEFALGEYGFTPIVHRDNTCAVLERDRLRDLASGRGGKQPTWNDMQPHHVGETIKPCLTVGNDSKVDLILPSECRYPNSRSGTCARLADWLSLDVRSPLGPEPESLQSHDIVDIIEEVSRRPTAIAFVTDLSLNASPSRDGVRTVKVVADSGGSVETAKRWGLFAYLPMVEVDGQYELADPYFLKCIVDGLRSLPDVSQNKWATARQEQANWLKGRRTKAAWSQYYDETKTGAPRVLRLPCPKAGRPICELADFANGDAPK